MPFTPDWDAADASIAALAELRPAALGAGHGRAMSDPGLANRLVRYAGEKHRPDHGRYVPEPAHFDAERGVVSLPPPVSDPAVPRLAAGATLGVLAWLGLRLRKR